MSIRPRNRVRLAMSRCVNPVALRQKGSALQVVPVIISRISSYGDVIVQFNSYKNKINIAKNAPDVSKCSVFKRSVTGFIAFKAWRPTRFAGPRPSLPSRPAAALRAGAGRNSKAAPLRRASNRPRYYVAEIDKTICIYLF